MHLTYCTPTGTMLEDGLFSQDIDMSDDVIAQVEMFGKRLHTLEQESMTNRRRSET